MRAFLTQPGADTVAFILLLCGGTLLVVCGLIALAAWFFPELVMDHPPPEDPY